MSLTEEWKMKVNEVQQTSAQEIAYLSQKLKELTLEKESLQKQNGQAPSDNRSQDDKFTISFVQDRLKEIL